MAYDGGQNINLLPFRRIFLFWLGCFAAILAGGTHCLRAPWMGTRDIFSPLAGRS